MSSSAPTSVPIAQLGLTSSEQQLMRQHQQLAQQTHGSAGSVSRGRGTARTSTPSSRAVSAASSQGGPPRLMIDVRSLSLLQQHFDHVLGSISRRIDVLQHTADASISHNQAMVARSQAAADAEIAKFKRLNEEMDRLDEEFDAIEKLQSVVSKLAERVREVSQRVDRASGSSAQTRRR